MAHVGSFSYFVFVIVFVFVFVLACVFVIVAMSQLWQRTTDNGRNVNIELELIYNKATFLPAFMTFLTQSSQSNY